MRSFKKGSATLALAMLTTSISPSFASTRPSVGQTNASSVSSSSSFASVFFPSFSTTQPIVQKAASHTPHTGSKQATSRASRLQTGSLVAPR
ncbi:hypothetical protein [Ferroacidibacillus organovorans]|uniref:hypothetical protein n=1 Tax=Ferroacidibacillus organovorans TaxID=1765683 RepID=UPI0009E87ABC|nr:hypothetical protein [Ferroacidibacillus organovorans]